MTKLPHWSLLQSFLAVAETGSLSAAADRLGLTQPTLGRQIKRLEADLGLTLFTRAARGLLPTEAAQSLIPRARAMAEAAQGLSLAAAGHQEGIAGTVRLTASKMVTLHILPPILARLLAEHPELQIELAPSDTTENLLFREADIAIRMYRPRQLDNVAKHLGDIPLTLCAAKSYLAAHGAPQTAEDFANHAFVGYDRSDDILQGMRAAGFPATRDWFRIRCDDQPTYWELVRAGAGIGFGQRPMVNADPTMKALSLPPGITIPVLPIWLATPEALRHTPRISLVWQHLATHLAPFVS